MNSMTTVACSGGTGQSCVAQSEKQRYPTRIDIYTLIDTMYKIGNWWELTAQRRELYPMLCSDLKRRKFKKGGDICMCRADSRGLPWWLSGKQSTCQFRRHGFDPWVAKILWRRKWQSTPIFLPEKSREEELWGCKRIWHDLATK